MMWEEESGAAFGAKWSVRGLGDSRWRCLRAAVCLGLTEDTWEAA